ncbi:DUF2199 domain-containing protein [Kitasatospora sp. NPDC051914]|uniref:DUF2199 domain-containing protein n=1 Tax=Kitasatospora sp. NPDC051914 TaxID=3154945 RepID=UPI0034150597
MHHEHHCTCCGEQHEGPPMSYAPVAPPVWKRRYALRRDCLLTEDLCVVKGEHFYVRGLIELPVLDAEETFSWGVWVSLSAANFDRMQQLWDNPAREQEPPYFGWLTTELPYPEPTLLLKTHVHTQSVGSRPLIELEPTDHPLAVEQREGITMARVHEFAEMLLGSFAGDR